MRSIRVLTFAVLAAFVSACATAPNPWVCAAAGGLLGGAGGAAVGAAHDTGDDLDEAAAGGAGGAIVGGALAYGLCWMLQKDEAPPPPPPTPVPTPYPTPRPTPVPTPKPEVREKIILRGVNFDFDKATIRPDAAVILDEAARLLNDNPGVNVRVEGHTDSTGPEAYNQGLSERRAASVKQYLVDRGVSASRLTTSGYGESQPIASNSTRDGRALNRRVELKVLN